MRETHLKLDNDQPFDALNNYDLPIRLSSHEGRARISYAFLIELTFLHKLHDLHLQVEI